MEKNKENLEEVKSTHSASETSDPTNPANGSSTKRPLDKNQKDKDDKSYNKDGKKVEVTPAGKDTKGKKATRSEAYAAISNKLSKLSLEEMQDYLDDISTKEDIKESNDIDEVTSEELDSLFESAGMEGISEKAKVIFESSVNAKVAEKAVELQEAFDKKLEEEKEASQNELTESLNNYLEYVVGQYMEENKLAIDNGIRSEISESFLEGMKSLFDEHYVNIPEDKVDVVESLGEEISELKKSLNEAVENNIESKKLIESYKTKEIISNLVEGVDATRADKIKTLAENVSFKDAEDYENRVKIIKESVLGKESNNEKRPDTLTEETSGVDTRTYSQVMQGYLDHAQKFKD